MRRPRGRGPTPTAPRSARASRPRRIVAGPVSFLVLGPWDYPALQAPYSSDDRGARGHVGLLHGVSGRPRRRGRSRAPQPETRAGRSGGRRAPQRGRDSPEPRFVGDRERPHGDRGRAEDVPERRGRRALQRLPRRHVLSRAGALHPKALSPGARFVEPAARGPLEGLDGGPRPASRSGGGRVLAGRLVP